MADINTKASATIDINALKVAGEPNKYITYIDSTNGIRVHEAGAVNTNFVQINSSGMQVYKGGQTDTYKIAEFKSYINLGTGHTNTYTGSAAMGVGLTTSKTNQIVVGRYNESNSNATFIIGDGTGSSDKSNLLTIGNINGKQITDTFVGNGNTNTFTLSNTPTSTPTVISTTTYTISSWSGTTITLNTNVVENERIQFQYTTNEKGGYLIIGNISGVHGKGVIVGGYSLNNSTMTASGGGASIHGGANNGTMTASGVGASIHGIANNSTMTASNMGTSIHGYANRDGTMTASGVGASIHGYAYNSTMTASSNGASIHGFAYDSTMTASGVSASIHGYANNGTMTASGDGASIHGIAYRDGTMTALGMGASIHGYAYNSTMTASKVGSIALNESTHALKRAQLAIGSFNADDSASATTHPSGNTDYGTYAFIIGNGTGESARSNALTVDWLGNVEAEGEIIGATSKTVITTFSSGWDVYSTDPAAPVTLRRCGKFVDLTGMIRNTTAVTLNATQVTIFTIPEGYRPSQTMTILSQGSTTNVFVIRIKASGEVTFERYRSTSSTSTSYSSISEGGWFPIHAAWIMD